ncbi:MAG: calcium-binding protein [Dehalococcoidia bacterium]
MRPNFSAGQTIARILCVAVVAAGLLALDPYVGPPAVAGTGDSITVPVTDPDQLDGADVVIDGNGNPVISFYGPNNLQILRCDDPLCAGVETPLVLDNGRANNAGGGTSLELDGNGFPVVSFGYGTEHPQTITDQSLRLVHCLNAACSQVSAETLDSSGTEEGVGYDTSLALAGALPIIAHHDLENNDLKVVRCNDANCSGGEPTQTPDTGAVEGAVSMALDTLGRPVISYVVGGALVVMHCNDADCAGGNESREVLGSAWGTQTSLALASGLPVVAYFDAAGLRILRCDDANCDGNEPAALATATVDVMNFNLSLELDGSGRPIVAYEDNHTIRLLRCANLGCDNNQENDTAVDFESPGFLEEPSLALADGKPVIAYDWVPPLNPQEGSFELRVAHCDDAGCLPPPPKCQGKTATIYNLFGDIDGTPGDDVIVGSFASDTIRGMGGDDTICGGGGSDMIFGDSTLADGGNDVMVGGADDDQLWGMAGNDSYLGGPGSDEVVLGAIDDHAIRLDLSTTARQNTGEGRDRFVGVENVQTGNGNDVLTGNGSDNRFFSWAGNDTLVGGGGDDQLNGGEGTDTVSYPGDVAVTVKLLLTTAQATGRGSDTLTAIENARGSTKADRLTGDGGPNRLDGLGGSDILRGGIGADKLYGGTGIDTLGGDGGSPDLCHGGGAEVDKFAGGSEAASGCETVQALP